MNLHVFADPGLMLAETAGVDLGAVPGLHFTPYRQIKQRPRLARVFQVLHILLRPVSLRLSAWFAQHFNACLAVDPEPLESALARVSAGDSVLWLNPSLAVQGLVDKLLRREIRVSLYFLDPVHRLGLAPATVRQWARQAQVCSYSQEESARLGLRFLVPYRPALAHTSTRDAAEADRWDLVYIGSPSPKRLAWVIWLQWQLRRQGRRGHLRLATPHAIWSRWLPGVFSPRVSFQAYAALCAHARGVLELHERDAGGVTLRATLCEAVGAVHLCNLATTAETVQLSLWRSGRLSAFLGAEEANFRPPRLDAPELLPWLQRHFG